MASIHDRFAVEHLVVVVYDDVGHGALGGDRLGERYRAECSCGWAGDWHDDRALAEADGDDHREVIVGPADHLDRLMAELLDLQDDLATVVVWLAEHWSADLPVPRCRSFGSEHAGVDLSAYCVAADDLERAAELLEVPLVDAPAPDGYGNRYRSATRSFGRVRFRVFRGLAATCDECGAEITGVACWSCGQRPDARAVTVEVG
jgi:hypothetical protein